MHTYVIILHNYYGLRFLSFTFTFSYLFYLTSYIGNQLLFILNFPSFGLFVLASF